jgi:hypothetical protein
MKTEIPPCQPFSGMNWPLRTEFLELVSSWLVLLGPSLRVSGEHVPHLIFRISSVGETQNQPFHVGTAAEGIGCGTVADK